MAVSGENVPEAEEDVGGVLETYEVDDVERLETRPEEVLTVESDNSSTEPVVEDEVETLLSDISSAEVQQTEEPETLASTTDEPIVGVFVSDPSVHVSEEDGTALDELFEELEEETPGNSKTEDSVVSSDGMELVGDIGTERRVSTEGSGIDDASETLSKASSSPSAPETSEQPASSEPAQQSTETDAREHHSESDQESAPTHAASGLSARVGKLLGDIVDDDTDAESSELPEPATSEGEPSVEAYEEEYSTDVTEALAEAEAEIDEYKSNILYDTHPDETDFEWVSDDEMGQS